ncbi:MAG: Pr6Pr family membrane protein [Ferruginibacter sp.]
MNQTRIKPPSFYLAGIAILGWFALSAQFYLIIQNRVVSVAETIIRYFSFFTILTNFIVALCVTFLLLKPNTRWGIFFSKTVTLTAITVYITIVGIVYNVILRFLWQPQGLQYVVDELLHTVIPILFILLWILFIPKPGLQYKNALPWLIYPLVYVIYTAIHGEMTGYYPYPFINIAELGYNKVLINTGGLLIAFLGLSLFFITVAKFMSRRNHL